MARSDSMMWFIVGFAQLIIANEIEKGFFNMLFSTTGGSSLVVGLYVLLFIARHSEEFTDAYSKFEKSELKRDENGSLTITNGDSTVKKGMGIAIPASITFISAIVWLATL
ncbi:MAG: hypothetical protein CND89_03495 [Marine Group II euryarchaeote MED-G38]|nr:MAG: hypothetical protein CND89_03495 [Marine Group II euryarchaeote MED-G38]